MKKFILLACIAFVTMGCKQQALTPMQKMKKAQAEAENIEKIRLPDFTFYPGSVSPQFGVERIINATSSSYLKVSQTNMSAQLPYLGSFYIQPLSRQEVPVKFYSSKFVYTVHHDSDKDVYDITILPQDVYELINTNMVIKLRMDKDGNGEVTIKTDGRDEISYQGYYR